MIGTIIHYTYISSDGHIPCTSVHRNIISELLINLVKHWRFINHLCQTTEFNYTIISQVGITHSNAWLKDYAGRFHGAVVATIHGDRVVVVQFPRMIFVY